MYMSSRWIFYPDFSLNIKWMHFHAFIKSLHTAVYVRIIVYSIIYLNVPYCLSCFLIFYSCFLIFAIINNSQEISLFIKGRFQNWHLFKGILLDVLIGKLQKKKKCPVHKLIWERLGWKKKKEEASSQQEFSEPLHMKNCESVTEGYAFQNCWTIKTFLFKNLLVWLTLFSRIKM